VSQAKVRERSRKFAGQNMLCWYAEIFGRHHDPQTMESYIAQLITGIDKCTEYGAILTYHQRCNSRPDPRFPPGAWLFCITLTITARCSCLRAVSIVILSSICHQLAPAEDRGGFLLATWAFAAKPKLPTAKQAHDQLSTRGAHSCGRRELTARMLGMSSFIYLHAWSS